jgi:hypothetical protein
MLSGLSDMAVGGTQLVLRQTQEGLGALSRVITRTQEKMRHSLNNMRAREPQPVPVSCIRANRIRRNDLGDGWVLVRSTNTPMRFR